jgi:hypothetical protein
MGSGYSLADLKYDLKSTCILPLLTIEAAENTGSSSHVGEEGDSDEETETDGDLNGQHSFNLPNKTAQQTAEDDTEEETDTDGEETFPSRVDVENPASPNSGQS